MTSNEKVKPVPPGPLAATAKLKAINDKYDEELFHAKDRGKLVAYATALAPVEILRAFDIEVALPENYAALCNSRKMAAEFCDVSEQYGYSGDVCSYILASFGSELANRGPYNGMDLPDPDLLVSADYACNTHVKWWENLSEHFHRPLFEVDAGYEVERPLREHHKAYLVSEFKRLISFLEEHTGKKFDLDRFKEIVALSDKASELWDEIGNCRKAIPNPLGPVDIFTIMIGVVLWRGTQMAVDFYQEVLAEVEERVKNKVGAVPNERFRLIWDIFPVFHRMRLFRVFAEAGAVIATDVYGDGFAGRIDPTDPFGSLAERYLNTFNRSSARGHADTLKYRAENWHIDGVVFHNNRACRYITARHLQMARIIENEIGIPTMMFEANMADPRSFSEGQVLTRIQAFLEVLEARKYGTSLKK